MTKNKNFKPVVHMPVLMDIGELEVSPGNSQRQSKHVHAELTKSIMTDGMDEALIAVPRSDGPGYWVVSGNHRLQICRELGFEQVPVVVRHDWGAIEHKLQLVRRNFVRGEIDKKAFTAAVNSLATESHLPMDAIIEGFGFENAEIFADYYKEEKKREMRMSEDAMAAPSMKLIDDLGLAISAIFEQYGSTVLNGFIIFPASGGHHLLIPTTPALKRSMEQIAQVCVAQGITMQVAMAGLLTAGTHATGFGRDNKKIAQVVADGVDQHDGNAKLDLLFEEKKQN